MFSDVPFMETGSQAFTLHVATEHVHTFRVQKPNRYLHLTRGKQGGLSVPWSEVKWKSLSCVWLFVTPWTIQSMESSRPDTGMGSLSLLQGIFPSQGSNPGLLHCRWILYQLSHQRSPRRLEWVAYPFFRGSSLPRNQTRVSCIAGGFFTNWAIRAALRG